MPERERERQTERRARSRQSCGAHPELLLCLSACIFLCRCCRLGGALRLTDGHHLCRPTPMSGGDREVERRSSGAAERQRERERQQETARDSKRQRETETARDRDRGTRARARACACTHRAREGGPSRGTRWRRRAPSPARRPASSYQAAAAGGEKESVQSGRLLERSPLFSAGPVVQYGSEEPESQRAAGAAPFHATRRSSSARRSHAGDAHRSNMSLATVRLVRAEPGRTTRMKKVSDE